MTHSIPKQTAFIESFVTSRRRPRSLSLLVLHGQCHRMQNRNLLKSNHSYALPAKDNVLIRNGDIKFQEENSMWADSTFFKTFDFKLVKGNPETALKEPFSIVLSETTAKKYFGKKDALGKTLLITGDAFPATVTGIMKDIPENSQIKGDLVLSMSTITKKWNDKLDEQWGSYGAQAYILLKPGTNAERTGKEISCISR